jgi:hypothetical protein
MLGMLGNGVLSPPEELEGVYGDCRCLLRGERKEE